jgi:hypothetical protein
MERPKSKRLPSGHPHSLHWRSITSPGRASKGPGKGNPKLKLLGAGALLVLGLCALASAHAQADVIYTYTGNPFTIGANGSPPPDLPYTTNDKVTGQFVEAAPLPSNITLQSITPTSFSFTDGVQTKTNLNTLMSSFKVTTDSSGDITKWQINLDPTQTHVIITEDTTNGNILDFGAIGPTTAAEVDNTPGSWSMSPVPAPIVGAGIPGLLAGFGAFRFWRGRSAAAAFVRRRHRSYQPAAA